MPFAAVLRITLPLCAILLLVPCGLAAIELDADGLLKIGKDDSPVTLDAALMNTLTHEQEIVAIFIEQDATLAIAPNTMVYLDGAYISVKGTLKVPSRLGTGFYSGDNPLESAPMNLTMDGGTLEILAGGSPGLIADSMNITLNAGGGQFDIVAGVTLESGSVSGQKGDVTKTGGGTWQVGNVSMGGTWNVQEGIVHFLDDVTVGKLNSTAGTNINGLKIDGGKSNFSIAYGGNIQGTLNDVGYLLLGDGSTTATLTIAGGLHDAEKIGIARNTTLDLKEGTSIKLTSEDAQNTYDDMVIEGTLRMSSAVGTDIYKEGLTPLDRADIYIILAGNTNSTGNVTGGIIEIYKDTGSDILIADTINTQVIGIGKIGVESGVTFESGQLRWGAAASQTDVTGAHVVVSGGGTYRAGEVDLGTGYFVVEEETTMEFLETVTAGALFSDAGTQVITHGNAEFIMASIDGNFQGNHQNLTLHAGGRVTGHITDVYHLTMGGDLLLAVDHTATPTISVNTWTLTEPETTRIRTIAGTESNTYQKAIQVTDDDSRQNLLAALQASSTALYRPIWRENSDDHTYLDLQLSILSVNDYVNSVWRKGGQNVTHVGGLIENYSMQSPLLRERLESLSDAQFQEIFRSALAGELAGNALRLAMHQPANSVFRHLDSLDPLRSPFDRRWTRGQVREGFNVWFNPFGQAEHAENDGNTFDGYDLTRYGFYLGGDVEIYKRAVAGVLFGYTNPNVKSDLGKISANDYTGGLYLRIPTAWEVVANMLVGFGNQDFSFRHTFGNTKFFGNSFFASAELSRPVSLHAYRLTPLIALDFQSAAMDDFAVYNPILGGILVEPEDLSQTALRVGLLGTFGRFRTRLQYMRQIAGNDFASSQTALLGNLSAATHVRSTQWGKDWLNVGVGGDLLTTRHWRISADYNFDLGQQTTSHLGSLNTVLTW